MTDVSKQYTKMQFSHEMHEMMMEDLYRKGGRVSYNYMSDVLRDAIKQLHSDKFISDTIDKLILDHIYGPKE